jgi:ABC-2 type transport system ATP-binding protein
VIAVRAAGVYRRYGRRWALVDVGFELAEGSVAMVTGRNGSGKSTLLRVLATALRPDRGSVEIKGHDVRTDRDGARRSIALLGHRTHLYEPLTAAENLAVRARFLGRSAERAAILEQLEEVGLAGRADDAVHTFSAGMRQRLALASVMQQQAPVVLLDEPYGHLDPQGFLLVDGLLDGLRRRGATVLMATHLLERGRALCDRALVLDEGRLLFSGASSQLPQSGAFAAIAEGG